MSRIVTKKEYNRRRLKFQIAGGILDFLITIACAAAAFLCIFLLLELYTWVKGDIPVSFSKFFDIAEKALHINRG